MPLQLSVSIWGDTFQPSGKCWCQIETWQDIYLLGHNSQFLKIIYNKWLKMLSYFCGGKDMIDPRARGRSHMSCKPWSQNHLSSPLPYSVRRESLTQGENLESTFWRYGIKEFAHCKKTHHNYLDTFKSKLSKLNGMFQRYFTMNYTLFYTHCLLVYNALLCLILQLFF